MDILIIGSLEKIPLKAFGNAEAFRDKNIVILAPGKKLQEYADKVKDELNRDNTIGIALNFIAKEFSPDYIFSSNMRRFSKIQGKTDAKCITTSNMYEAINPDYIVDFSKYSLEDADIIDNSGLMLIKLLIVCGVKSVKIAGMDGYSSYDEKNYIDSNLEDVFAKPAERRTLLISSKLKELQKKIDIKFITPSFYE